MNPYPKFIHQTWKTQDIPEVLRFCTDSWQKLNPQWQYILWTDESMDAFVHKHYPQILTFYRAYTHNIFRADLFRLLVIQQMGGVYADLDMECLKSLDFLFEHYVNTDEAQVVLSYEPPEQSKQTVNVFPMYQAVFLAGRPNNEVLGMLIGDCLKKGNSHEVKDVVHVTGPAALTASLQKILPSPKVAVLDYKITNPVLDISNGSILRPCKRSSYKMLLKRKFYSETCMVHYWHHAYWDRKPILAWSREELAKEYNKSRNPLYIIKDLLYRILTRLYYLTKSLFKK